MQKNPNFEWKPVSTGNEKFMIVLSWLVVAFIVIIVGLYYGKSNRLPNNTANLNTKPYTADSNTPIGQGSINVSKNADNIINTKVLGKNEVYTIELGSPKMSFSKSEATSNMSELLKKGYSAKIVEIDSRNQRYHILAGKFKSYTSTLSEIENIKTEKIPASITIVSTETASTFLNREAKNNSVKIDPIKELIKNNERGAARTTVREIAKTPVKINQTDRTNELQPKKIGELKADNNKIETTNMLATKLGTASTGGEKINHKMNGYIPLSKPVSITRIDKKADKKDINNSRDIIDYDDDLSLNDEEKTKVTSVARKVASSGEYKVQLASFGSIKYADNYKNKLEKDGFSPVNIKELKSSTSNKTWYVVRIEGFENHSKASNFVKTTLKSYDSKIQPLIRR